MGARRMAKQTTTVLRSAASGRRTVGSSPLFPTQAHRCCITRCWLKLGARLLASVSLFHSMATESTQNIWLHTNAPTDLNFGIAVSCDYNLRMMMSMACPWALGIRKRGGSARLFGLLKCAAGVQSYLAIAG